MLLPPAKRDTKFFVGRREYDPVARGLRDHAGRRRRRGRLLARHHASPGNHNTGHAFAADAATWSKHLTDPKANPLPHGVIGPEFTDEERFAIIEYLKVHRDLPATPADYQPPQCRLRGATPVSRPSAAQRRQQLQPVISPPSNRRSRHGSASGARATGVGAAGCSARGPGAVGRRHPLRRVQHGRVADRWRAAGCSPASTIYRRFPVAATSLPASPGCVRTCRPASRRRLGDGAACRRHRHGARLAARPRPLSDHRQGPVGLDARGQHSLRHAAQSLRAAAA